MNLAIPKTDKLYEILYQLPYTQPLTTPNKNQSYEIKSTHFDWSFECFNLHDNELYLKQIC